MTKHQFQDFINEYFTQLEGVKQLSENSLKAYKKDLTQFLNFCTENDIHQINQLRERTIRNYILFLNEKNLNKNTISRKLSALRGFIEFLINSDKINSNPTSEIPNPKIKRNIPETISLDSFLKIYKLVDERNNGQREQNSHCSPGN